jgi:phospholipid/cholesterol/gamma-HCH transport system substrate-binding protein
MKTSMTNEAKTGMIVLVCIVALIALILKVGNFSFKEGYSVKTQFHFASGVKKHSPVRLSGVDVGEVKAIRLIDGDETVVELDLKINEGTKIRLNSTAYITTLGLMGEKYIEIKAGNKEAEYAKPGDLIPGKDPVSLEDLIAMGTKIGDDIGKMAQDISHLAKNIDSTVSDNRNKIDHIFENLDETSENFKDFSEDIKWHPWKVLMKGKEKPKEEIVKLRAEKKAAKQRTS